MKIPDANVPIVVNDISLNCQVVHSRKNIDDIHIPLGAHFILCPFLLWTQPWNVSFVCAFTLNATVNRNLPCQIELTLVRQDMEQKTRLSTRGRIISQQLKHSREARKRWTRLKLRRFREDKFRIWCESTEACGWVKHMSYWGTLRNIRCVQC